jgi:hypothetical protein
MVITILQLNQRYYLTTIMNAHVIRPIIYVTAAIAAVFWRSIRLVVFAVPREISSRSNGAGAPPLRHRMPTAFRYLLLSPPRDDRFSG